MFLSIGNLFSALAISQINFGIKAQLRSLKFLSNIFKFEIESSDVFLKSYNGNTAEVWSVFFSSDGKGEYFLLES